MLRPALLLRGLPKLSVNEPFKPSLSSFFITIFIIPAVPSASYLADGFVEVEANKLLTYQAAWSFDQNMDILSLSALAKLQACKSFREISATTIQIFGGMGFTTEADPQLFFKRAKHLQNYLWDEPYLEMQIEKNFFN